MDRSGRPKTLREVSHRVNGGWQAFDPAVLEFLDEFYANPSHRAASLRDEPDLIDDVKDAYLAAVAEHLAMTYRLAVPDWADGHGRPLKRAFFAGGLESLKAILTVESPAAFRRRLLFVGKDALDRPRRLGSKFSVDQETPPPAPETERALPPVGRGPDRGTIPTGSRASPSSNPEHC